MGDEPRIAKRPSWARSPKAVRIQLGEGCSTQSFKAPCYQIAMIWCAIGAGLSYVVTQLP